jgi:AcrR family transcriptional regulator
MASHIERPKKLTRQENAIHQHAALIESAIQSVGTVGFNESSVSRITDAAGVAQGTLYSYFGSYQVMLSQLLPVEGARLLKALGDHTHSPEGFFAEERRRFETLLHYLEERPYILRLLIEAEIATPEAFLHYMSEIGHRYTPVFRDAQATGEMRPIPPREIQVIAETLAGCRAHIALAVLEQRQQRPEAIGECERNAISAYYKFLRDGIGAKSVPVVPADRRSVALALKQAVRAPNSAAQMRASIFEAAGPEIAFRGFADTMVKRIVAAAGISIGTFYAHFNGREEFLSAFLTYARRQVTRYVAEAAGDSKSFAELEVRSFQALFKLFTQKPWLTRLAAEAAVRKPAEYQHHFTVISRSYRRKMMAAKARGELKLYKKAEIETLSVIFTAARRFLGTRFVGRSAGVLPKWVVKAYIKLVCCGLGPEQDEELSLPKRSTVRSGAARRHSVTPA